MPPTGNEEDRGNWWRTLLQIIAVGTGVFVLYDQKSQALSSVQSDLRYVVAGQMHQRDIDQQQDEAMRRYFAELQLEIKDMNARLDRFLERSTNAPH